MQLAAAHHPGLGASQDSNPVALHRGRSDSIEVGQRSRKIRMWGKSSAAKSNAYGMHNERGKHGGSKAGLVSLAWHLMAGGWQLSAI